MHANSRETLHGLSLPHHRMQDTGSCGLTIKRIKVGLGKMSLCYEFLDDLIREFLLFRGFAATLRAFDNDLKNEKERAFRPDR